MNKYIKTAAEISEYLITGFNHNTPEAQIKIAQIIKENCQEKKVLCKKTNK